MAICTLKGVGSESINEIYYQEIKSIFQKLISLLVARGFSPESIQIYFEDEKRQIHFGYYPDEIEALFEYAEYDSIDFRRFTLFNFSEPNNTCTTYRYYLSHYKTKSQYAEEIRALCFEYEAVLKRNHISKLSWSFFNQSKNSILEADQKKSCLRSVFERIARGSDSQYGIFINEIHHHAFPKKFLIANLDYFKTLGIKTLFFEFLFYERHQVLLDAYFDSETEDLPFELVFYLKAKDKWSNCIGASYIDIIKAAKRAGIRVVALDSYASLLSASDLKSNNSHLRLKSFNGRAANIIQIESNGNPYLVFLGLDHGYTQGFSGKVKSVTELVSCSYAHSIFLYDRNFNDIPVQYWSEDQRYVKIDRFFGRGRFEKEEVEVDTAEKDWGCENYRL